MSLSELGEAALRYATKEGLYVFPIVPRQKAPALIKDYYNQSSCDPNQIQAWWENTPHANIGLDCGKSGIVAIDVDSEAGHGKDHAGVGAPLAGLMLVSGGRKAWATRTTQTPTGGEHYLFLGQTESEGSIKSGSDNFGIPGIDVRARGGYVVLPPSIVTGANGELSYEFSNSEVAFLPLPRKLLSPPGQTRNDAGQTEIEAILASKDQVKSGGRDNFLIAYAGKFVDLGLNRTEIRSLIEAAYNTRCDDGDSPFTSQDFDRLTNSAMKWKPKYDVAAKIQAAVANQPEGFWNPKDETLAIPGHNFLLTNQQEAEYVVDKLFQRASLNMFMGPPKAGKSTLLRRLALDVAYGLTFLGHWPTVRTPVLYYTLQENKPHLRKWLLEAIWGEGLYEVGEVPSDVPIDFIFRIGHRGHKAIDAMRERITERNYGLVIIDMLGRFAGVESFDDYAENEAITDALNSVAQDTNTCIIWSHHEKKSSTGFDGAIGSQSIRGAVYTTLRNWKDKGRYYIATEQRDGDDVPNTAVRLDSKTQRMHLVGSHVTMEITDAINRESLVRGLLSNDEDLGAKEITAQVGGKQKDIQNLIDRIKGAK